MKCSRLFFVGRMHQCQQVLRQIGRNAGVDVINLARLALKGRIQASTEHIQVALAGQPQCLLIAGKLAQKPVAVIELMYQRPALMNRLFGLPLRAAVEPRQLALVPPPLSSQTLQQLALPLRTPLCRVAGQLTIDLQIQTAAHQLQALYIAPCVEVLLYTPIHHDIGVQLIKVQLVGVHRVLETQTQALHLRMLAGVHLNQQ